MRSVALLICFIGVLGVCGHYEDVDPSDLEDEDNALVQTGSPIIVDGRLDKITFVQADSIDTHNQIYKIKQGLPPVPPFAFSIFGFMLVYGLGMKYQFHFRAAVGAYLGALLCLVMGEFIPDVMILKWYSPGSAVITTLLMFDPGTMEHNITRSAQRTFGTILGGTSTVLMCILAEVFCQYELSGANVYDGFTLISLVVAAAVTLQFWYPFQKYAWLIVGVTAPIAGCGYFNGGGWEKATGRSLSVLVGVVNAWSGRFLLHILSFGFYQTAKGNNKMIGSVKTIFIKALELVDWAIMEQEVGAITKKQFHHGNEQWAVDFKKYVVEQLHAPANISDEHLKEQVVDKCRKLTMSTSQATADLFAANKSSWQEIEFARGLMSLPKNRPWNELSDRGQPIVAQTLAFAQMGWLPIDAWDLLGKELDTIRKAFDDLKVTLDESFPENEIAFCKNFEDFVETIYGAIEKCFQAVDGLEKRVADTDVTSHFEEHEKKRQLTPIPTKLWQVASLIVSLQTLLDQLVTYFSLAWKDFGPVGGTSPNIRAVHSRRHSITAGQSRQKGK